MGAGFFGHVSFLDSSSLLALVYKVPITYHKVDICARKLVTSSARTLRVPGKMVLYEKATVTLSVPSLHGTALAPAEHCPTAANDVRHKVHCWMSVDKTFSTDLHHCAQQCTVRCWHT